MKSEFIRLNRMLYLKGNIVSISQPTKENALERKLVFVESEGIDCRAISIDELFTEIKKAIETPEEVKLSVDIYPENLNKIAKTTPVIYFPEWGEEKREAREKTGKIYSIKIKNKKQWGEDSISNEFFMVLDKKDDTETYLHEVLHLNDDPRLENAHDREGIIEEQTKAIMSYSPGIAEDLRISSVLSMMNQLKEMNWSLNPRELEARRRDYLAKYNPNDRILEMIHSEESFEKEAFFEDVVMNYYFYDELKGALMTIVGEDK